jgi:hypothetical protein
MRTKLAIGIGAAVAIFVIVFCALPLQEVSYQGTEKYLAPEGYYLEEPYTEQIPYTVNESRGFQEPYTVKEPYIIMRPIRDPDTHDIIGYEPITRYSTVLKHRPATVYGSTTEYRQVTLYGNAAGQSYVWKERPVTLYKKVSFIEALIGGY